jgi:hypothetical protein
LDKVELGPLEYYETEGWTVGIGKNTVFLLVRQQYYSVGIMYYLFEVGRNKLRLGMSLIWLDPSQNSYMWIKLVDLFT